MNYEALGRYTAACEEVKALQRDRLSKVATLREHVGRAEHGAQGGHEVKLWDSSYAKKLLEEIIELDRRILEGAQEANLHAEAAGRSKFAFRQLRQH